MGTAGVTRRVSLRPPAAVGLPASRLGFAPSAWLGATAPGGLALPSASPAADTMYAPRGIAVNDHHLVVADTGNHRVLIWHGVPDTDHRPADVLLGQNHFTDDGPQCSGAGPHRGLSLPTGVILHDGGLVVCDAWNHRILIWRSMPERSCAPDVVLGQTNPKEYQPNRGGEPGPTSFYWPFGAAFVDGGFWVADTGNRRVLGWLGGLPDSPDQSADVVLGQSDFLSRAENRGADAAANSFRWPHALASAAGGLLIADAGNHRVLGWRGVPRVECPADRLIGQDAFADATEFPYAPQTAARLRFPYGIAADGGELAIADTANNRILLWDHIPDGPTDAMGVLGQPTMISNGENRWDRVDAESLCWPYGLARHGNMIAVADSGNNRAMVWRRS